jgi:hypothetical protein
VTAPYVLIESGEIAERYGADRKDAVQLAHAKSRVELWSDDDPQMDHINDYIFVLEAMERFTGAIIFEPQNGQFIDFE